MAGKFSWNMQYLKDIIPEIPNLDLSPTFSSENLVSDFTNAISIWTNEEGTYSFVHRSLQEYYAALLVHSRNTRSKIKIYNTIRDIQIKFRQEREFRNFLDLCKEIDEIDFYRYYQIPILNKLNETILASSNIELNVVNLFFPILIISKFNKVKNSKSKINNIFIDIVINWDKISESLYFHLEQSRLLHTAMSDLKFLDFDESIYKVCSGKEVVDFFNGNSILPRYNEPNLTHQIIDFRIMAPSIFNIEFFPFLKNEINSIIEYIKLNLADANLKVNNDDEFNNTF